MNADSETESIRSRIQYKCINNVTDFGFTLFVLKLFK